MYANGEVLSEHCVLWCLDIVMHIVVVMIYSCLNIVCRTRALPGIVAPHWSVQNLFL